MIKKYIILLIKIIKLLILNNIYYNLSFLLKLFKLLIVFSKIVFTLLNSYVEYKEAEEGFNLYNL